MPRTLLEYQPASGRPRPARTARSDRSPDRVTEDLLLVGVIHTTDAIRRIIAARSEEELSRQLASYVRTAAAERLWPKDAEQVEQAMVRGDVEFGVATYFERVGDRWDPEWLVVDRLEVPGHGA
jgi:hypothetical protein